MGLKLKKLFDDTKILGAISDISAEIEALKKTMEDGIVSARNDNESIVSEIREGNKTMLLILDRLDEIENDIKDIRSTTWYSRMFCM